MPYSSWISNVFSFHPVRNEETFINNRLLNHHTNPTIINSHQLHVASGLGKLNSKWSELFKSDHKSQNVTTLLLGWGEQLSFYNTKGFHLNSTHVPFTPQNDTQSFCRFLSIVTLTITSLGSHLARWYPCEKMNTHDLFWLLS